MPELPGVKESCSDEHSHRPHLYPKQYDGSWVMVECEGVMMTPTANIDKVEHCSRISPHEAHSFYPATMKNPFLRAQCLGIEDSRSCILATPHAAHRPLYATQPCPGIEVPATASYSVPGGLLIREVLEESAVRFARVIGEAMARFARKHAEYGEGAADDLGLAGQWGDLHRKTAKLRREMWGGDPIEDASEDAAQILQDIIGHAILAIDMIERGFEGGK
jgi:hypothetical protein